MIKKKIKKGRLKNPNSGTLGICSDNPHRWIEILFCRWPATGYSFKFDQLSGYGDVMGQNMIIGLLRPMAYTALYYHTGVNTCTVTFNLSLTRFKCITQCMCFVIIIE